MIRIEPRALDRLLRSLEEETAWIDRIHRLAHRQRRYMVRRQERRVKWVSEEIERALPRARELAQVRQVAVSEAMGGRSSSLKLLLQQADTPQRERVESAVAALAAAGDRLHRRNVQNYQLASFALDLTQEEIRVIAGGHARDEAYSADGHRRLDERSGVLDGRA